MNYMSLYVVTESQNLNQDFAVLFAANVLAWNRDG